MKKPVSVCYNTYRQAHYVPAWFATCQMPDSYSIHFFDLTFPARAEWIRRSAGSARPPALLGTLSHH